MITAIASGLHGHNTFSKGYIIAGAALVWGATSYLISASLIYSGVVALLSIGWWFLLRGSKQAKIELDKMDTINQPHPSYLDVLKAHYYTGWLTILALKIWNYGTKAGQVLGWEHQAAQTGRWKGKSVRVDHHGRVHQDDIPFWACRRPTELATGLTFDILLFTILALL